MLYAQLESRVQTCLDELVKSGKAVGLQAAVVHRGELVAEAWSGIADTRTERPVDRDILFPVFSMTKGVAATLVHLVAGAGRLNYDAPLADYWPEFGCRGKEKITMRMVLSHTAGVPQLPEAESHEEFADFERMAAAVAGAGTALEARHGVPLPRGHFQLARLQAAEEHHRLLLQ